MNFDFEIVPVFETGLKAQIYTFRLEGEYMSEFKKFELNPDVRSHHDLLPLVRKINQIRDKYGCREDWFRDESEFYQIEAIKRIYYGKGDLRLYCIRWSKSLLFMGDGGIKLPGTIRLQQNPRLLAIVNRLETIYKALIECIKYEGLTIEEIIHQ